jgi:hypothetical protein
LKFRGQVGGLAIWLLAFMLCGLLPAMAQNPLEKLVMPGKLIEGHAKLEADCANCHVTFSPNAQDGLCLSCHKPIDADIKTKRGMHGMRKDAAANACRYCHGDHKGREADIVQLDRAAFDHNQTNFRLIGRHATTGCEGCHKPTTKSEARYRLASSACIDCHRTSDPHKGGLDAKCDSCHNTVAWKQTKLFDHGTTKFALTGSHAGVGCASCHAGERYKGVSMACVDCHREKDVHKAKHGAKCDSCHKTSRWDDVEFDHSRHTGFPLLGKHASATCEKCHTADPHLVKLGTACLDCHSKDDERAHKGQMGKDCLKCHSEADWKSDVKFNHDQTRYPLRGKHAAAKCDDCHKSKDYKGAPTACAGCHNDKKSHDGRLGTDCAQCHNVMDWKRVRFNHDTQTKFKLTGRHAKATCYSCHTKRGVEKATLPADCYSCHKAQDQHRGAFGRDCAACHSTSNFTTAVIRR